MIVWLVDYDGKIPNLALMRLSTYHRKQGDIVRLKLGEARPELWEMPDKVYISCIFRWNHDKALALADAWNGRAIAGGTGIDIAKLLPAYAAECQPDDSLYGNDYALGFVSRGCIRRCPWCVVPRKEGALKRVSTAREIVGRRKRAVFLDNNFLALSDHCDDLNWLISNRVETDFNQGLDARLVTKENAQLLAQVRWSAGLRLALDSESQYSAVERAIKLLSDYGMTANYITIFVLIGFSGIQSDIERLRFVHKLGARAFPMGYRDLDTGYEPARGWNRTLYRKYRRLIIRLPHANSVWEDFEKEIWYGTDNGEYSREYHTANGELDSHELAMAELSCLEGFQI